MTYSLGALGSLGQLGKGDSDKRLGIDVVEPTAQVNSEILASLELTRKDGVGLEGAPKSDIGDRDFVADKVAAKSQVVVQLLKNHVQRLEVVRVDNILAFVDELVNLSQNVKMWR